MEQVKLILDERVKRMKTMFYTFCRFYSTILEFVDKKNCEKIILQNKETVISAVDNLPFDFNQKMVCKFLQISTHQYKVWKHNLRYKIAHSFIVFCTKRYPHQISNAEIKILKSITAR